MIVVGDNERMPRPSLADLRRPQLLDAYARCLVRFGLEGSTLDRIAEEAGVTRALVRHYLGNREDVDRALVSHVRDRYVEWFVRLGAGRPPRQRLAAVLDALFDEGPDQPTQVVDALLGASAEDPLLQASLREMYLELEHLLDAEIASAYPSAEPSTRRRAAYSILCLAGTNGSLVALGFPRDRSIAARTSAERLLDDLVV
jgi:AcrR family transcriptional regulator